MRSDFEVWLNQVAPRDELDPGVRPAGADRVLREIFDDRGPISQEEVRAAGRRIQLGLAAHAVALVLRDLHATTEARPNVDVRYDDEYGLVVSYNGGWTTPPMSAMRDPEATAEIADYLQGEIVEDLWGGWPSCPAHSNGAHAETLGGDAVWYCRYGKHPVAVIGSLAP
ncbi:hypothetical protein [Jatrophihabitans sp.]|uniref:hypothetical protein n=1 Tax=Jatrophihabitans sp. TaxID=1932789 RepID=UPI0030C6E6FB|nr:hypothetical protein [Jatrophihabitans sp.]